MKIVVAPDSFKGSLSALEAANYIEAGIIEASGNIEVVKIPAADGGEGTVEALIMGAGGNIIRKTVTGPLNNKIDSFFGILGDGTTAVIEMAAAAGLTLIPADKRNPLDATTYGVGELILAAVDRGCNRIIVGLGGSATNDGGMGMAQAFGVEFTDREGNLLGQGGRFLADISSIDVSKIDKRLSGVEIVAACDVKNPLFGPEGASHVYGPQKGAFPEMVKFLDEGMENYANCIERDLGTSIANIPGSGAAGGLGGGLIAFTGAVLRPGIDIVIETCKFEGVVKDADLLITGEGRTDFQTAYGKVPVGLAAIAKKYEVPVVCLSGGLGNGFEEVYGCGIDSAFSIINNAMPLQEAIANAGELLTQSAYALTRLILKFASR